MSLVKKKNFDSIHEPLKVGLLLFNEVEVLDFAGPFEVFSIAEHPKSKEKLCKVIIISEKDELIKARNGLKVKADYTIYNHPDLDILVIPGGYGAEEIEINNLALLSWIKKTSQKLKLTASVCTGAFLLAKSGVLSDEAVCTHHLDRQRLQKEFPKLTVLNEGRFHHNKERQIISSAGISAGIEMSLYLLSFFFSKEVALKTAERMEYNIGSVF